MARNDDSAGNLDKIVDPLAMLDASMARGLADADAGRVYDLEAVAEALDARYADFHA
jgi:predicted transcriptional regulator